MILLEARFTGDDAVVGPRVARDVQSPADMIRKPLPSLLLVAVVGFSFAGALFAQPKTISGTRQYMYLSDQRILTLEIDNSEKIILNYINLGDAYDLIEAPMVVLVDELGQSYRGQVMAIEPVTDPAERYKVSELLPPKQFKGFTILGNFRMDAPAKAAYFKTGGRIMELEADDCGGFREGRHHGRGD